MRGLGILLFFSSISFFAVAEVPCANGKGELEKVSSNVLQAPNLCAVARDHRATTDMLKHPEQYYVFTYLFTAAGTTYTASDRNTVIQDFWKNNYKGISCEEGWTEPGGGLLKQIVYSNFRDAADDIAGPKSKYNLDLNVKDPVDNLTILDWIREQRKRTDLTAAEVEDLKYFDDFFAQRGAKTSNQL